ncbi:MAG: D-alanyl-D-alanine carboxypeptidase family protein [Pseudomonadota bacterium]|nr:D-alanyl-D-alanine carboxypeptidase family protein [Pseudomonadota bacterium]
MLKGTKLHLLLIWITYSSIAVALSDFAQKKLLLPPPPTVNAQAYIIMDAKTGAILAQKDADTEFAPASLTKLMTSYIIFHALEQGHIGLNDPIHISTNAWRSEGSRLFLSENSTASLQTLLKGLIITSGNDASVALSEHFAGSEDSFAVIMNRYAEKIGLTHSHFVTATGLDHPDHFSSAKDIATLSQHIIEEFPQYFHWFHERSITHNGITQNNRNSLLFHHPEIDGLKTGYTSKAGYCLSTTAQKNNTRLIVVTLNSSTPKYRNSDTLSLLNYGFRFFESALLYPKDTIITSVPVYLGVINNVDLKVQNASWASLPKGSRDEIQLSIDIDQPIQAPLSVNQSVGSISVTLDGEFITSYPLYPSEDVQESRGVSYLISYIKMFFSKWF